MKFQVGDKVKTLSESLLKSIRRGEICIVTDVDYEFEGNNCVLVVPENKNSNGIYRSHQLELIEPKKSKNQRIAELEKKVEELEGNSFGDYERIEELENRIEAQRESYNQTVDRILDFENRIKSLESVLAEKTKLTSTDVIREWDEIMKQDEIIEFEGNQYRKVDRKAELGDVVVFRNNHTNTQAGKPYKTIEKYGSIYYIDDEGYNGYSCGGWGGHSQYDTYEPIKQELTPNHQRAEIIEKAKKFVEKKLNGSELAVPDSRGSSFGPWWLSDFEFVVNTKKRAIAVLCKGFRGVVRERAIAKCNPSDVFNEHIGKAIALGRALGLDVSEFEQAVQPSVAIGQILGYRNNLISKSDEERWEVLKLDGSKNLKILNENSRFFGQFAEGSNLQRGNWYRIINDTNAQYEGVK